MSVRLVLALVLAVPATLVAGESPPAEEEPAAAGSPEPYPFIDLEPAAPAPAWRTRLEEQLETPVTFSWEEVPIEDAVDQLRRMTEVNVAIDPEVHLQGVPPINLIVEEMTLGHAFACIAELTGTHFGLVDGAAYFQVAPFPVDLPTRAYPVGPVTEVLGIDADDLIDLIRVVVAPESWESKGVKAATYAAGPWDGPALVIDQTAEIHDRIREVLGQLRHRRQLPLPPPPAWRAELERALDRELPIVSFLEEELVGVAEFLSRETGCDVAVDPGLVAAGDLPPVDLRLRRLPLREVLDLLARQTGIVWRLHNEAIYLTDRDGPGPELVLQVYNGGPSDRWGNVGTAVDILQEATLDAWEVPGTGIDTVGNLLVVNQTREVHARLAEIVATFVPVGEPADQEILKGLERAELDLLLEELIERIRKERYPGF